jgi:hypothetical protein
MGSQFGLHRQSFCYTPKVENPGESLLLVELVAWDLQN